MKVTGLFRAAVFASLAVVGCLWTRSASADIELYNNKGWTFYTNGRLDGFLSFTFGDGYPLPPVDPTTMMTKYTYVGGSGLTGAPGITDDKNKITSTRVRSGYLGNILAFGLKKELVPGTLLKGYFAIWSAIETDHTRFHPVTPDVRESYLNVEGPWGSVLVGRTLGLFGKMSVDIDFNYGHGNALGYPCTLDETRTPGACGQIGFGVIFPYFSAGAVYKTPSLGGLTLAGGLYDPVTYPGKWELTPLPRVEGELAYTKTFGEGGKFIAAAEGLWQRVGNIGSSRTADAMGVAGGARLEVGPVRIGAAAHYGSGLGFFYALEDTPTSTYTALANAGPMMNISDDPNTDGKLRTYSGYYGQVMLVLSKLDVFGGVGVAHLNRLDQLDVNRPDGFVPTNVLPKDNLGINGGLAYHIDDNLVADIDYFRAQFSWYDGAQQGVNTLNTGLTMLW